MEILFVDANVKDCRIVPPRNDDYGEHDSYKKIVTNSGTDNQKSFCLCFPNQKNISFQEIYLNFILLIISIK